MQSAYRRYIIYASFIHNYHVRLTHRQGTHTQVTKQKLNAISFYFIEHIFSCSARTQNIKRENQIERNVRKKEKENLLPRRLFFVAANQYLYQHQNNNTKLFCDQFLFRHYQIMYKTNGNKKKLTIELMINVKLKYFVKRKREGVSEQQNGYSFFLPSQLLRIEYKNSEISCRLFEYRIQVINGGPASSTIVFNIKKHSLRIK